ncbi:MAG: redox-regulated ATPase YchF, partial [Methanosarcinales archaeon]|nr:redox-regulated ATPase YchF [Methanosarcinales archaeon]
MSLSIALAGKPNCGKSTFFKAATLANVEIANYPFTTIDANHGITYVRTNCPCKDLESRCGNCTNGERFVPIELIDVAGLVPDAHLGKGLGNTFLDHLRQANAIIHVIDASGGTDIEGNPVDIGSHDPVEDVAFLEYEITMWIVGILKRNWDRLSRKIKGEGLKIEKVLAEQLEGAGVSETHIRIALLETKIDQSIITKWTDEEIIGLADEMRKASKPLIIAANKFDIAPKENVERLLALDYTVIPTSCAAELALKMAAKGDVIDYLSGDRDFNITGNVTEQQSTALGKMKELLVGSDYSGTGVQECINEAVFVLLNQIVAYPVEDEGKFSDKKGRVLPDAYLLKNGSTAKDLAYMVHSDIGDGFLYG